MRIRAHLRWLIGIGFTGLLIFAAVAFTTLRQITINGPVYRSISLRKDLVIDYVPPPQSLLPIALYLRMMSEAADRGELERYLALFRDQARLFEEQHADYMRRVPEGALKELVSGTAYETAEQYLRIARERFIPLVIAGEQARARAVLVSEMKPLYDTHASAVERIVAAANQEAREGESLAAAIVRTYTGIMVSVGLLILLAGGTFSFVIARGISRQTEALVRSEQSRQEQVVQLRALAARLQSIREEERTRVAREIHDQLGQALTAIKLDVSAWFRRRPADRPPRPETIQPIVEMVDDTIQLVRRIATELRPAILDDLGLVATVEWAGREFETRTGTRCRLELPRGDVATDPERATALFRIFQEALTNIARHANASHVNVRLATGSSGLYLEVRDNGTGIPESKVAAASSLGLMGMRERAILLGGDLTVTGGPGQGTTVRVRVPEVARA